MAKSLPPQARAILKKIPPQFRSDGCTQAPDKWFGWDLRWACRIHDWRYCTRCHPQSTMTAAGRKWADLELRLFMRDFLPWRWRWLGWIYYIAVRRYAGISSFDSCDLRSLALLRHDLACQDKEQPQWMKEGTCRHGILVPTWML